MRPRQNLGSGVTVRLSWTLLMVFLIGQPKPLFAATRIWTGAGGDGFWINPANWNDQVLPMPGDDVLLDQSVLGINYTVTLPVTGTIVKSIAIHPDPNQ